MRRFAKHELELMVLGVYQILCKCREVYVRHSRRTIEARCSEKQTYICLHQPGKPKLAEHCSTMGHSINLRGTSILLGTSGYMDCHLGGGKKERKNERKKERKKNLNTPHQE